MGIPPEWSVLRSRNLIESISDDLRMSLNNKQINYDTYYIYKAPNEDIRKSYTLIKFWFPNVLTCSFYFRVFSFFKLINYLTALSAICM